MADGYGTIVFDILGAGMVRTQSAEISVTHIPGGDVSYVDFGGLLPVQLSYQLVMTQAMYLAMEGLVGGTASLTTTIGDGTITSAMLMGVERKSRVPVSGTTFASAEFLVITA